MKADIHPVYYDDAQVVCACGNTFTTGSTKQLIRVEICAKCHPFFTGQMKFLDTQGQIQKFAAKQQKAVQMADAVAKKKAKRTKTATEAKNGPLTLKEMLMSQDTKTA